MGTDFLTLIRRDHHDLENGLDELLAPDATIAQIRTSLDGIRLGLTAHAEAEDIVLHGALARYPALQSLIAQARGAHLAQEGALAMLVCARPHGPTWRDRALYLRRLVAEHAAWEEDRVLPAIRTVAPGAYGALAGAFATERMRQLAMLQPSAPIALAELAAS